MSELREVTEEPGQMNYEDRLTNHRKQAHLTDHHSHRPGHMSRKWGCSGHSHTSTD